MVGATTRRLAGLDRSRRHPVMPTTPIDRDEAGTNSGLGEVGSSTRIGVHEHEIVCAVTTACRLRV